jgi:RNA polymerase sigma factor (TIGR02999 family)
MTDVIRILAQLESGDPTAAEQLLPLVYEELRQLAAARLQCEQPGQTLQPTALVHEAYLRLIGDANPVTWNSRGHFFGAAAEAMRRILVDAARRKQRTKHGGQHVRRELDPEAIATPELHEDLLALDEALERLTVADPQAGEMVQLRYFAGLPLAEAAEVLGISPRSADRLWAYARAWLRRELRGKEGPEKDSG